MTNLAEEVKIAVLDRVNSQGVSQFHVLAAGAVLKKAFSANYFDVQIIDQVCRTLGRDRAISSQDYEALRSLHCMGWADMSKELKSRVQQKIIQAIGLDDSAVFEEAPTQKVERSLLALFRA